VQYCYKVSAVNSAGEGGQSGQLCGTPQAVSVGVPGAPTGLTAKPANGKGVQLNWTAPSSDGGSGITSYQVWRAPAGGAYVQISLTTLTSLKDASTARGASYTYEVRAVNSAGPGPFSTPAGPVTAT